MVEVAEEALAADAGVTAEAEEASVEAAAGVASVAAVTVMAANKPTFPPVPAIGSAPTSTAATPTLPGEKPATNANSPSPRVLTVATPMAAEALAEAVEAEEALAAAEATVTVEAEAAEEASAIVAAEALAAAVGVTVAAEEALAAAEAVDPIAVEALAIVAAVTTVTGLTKKNWFHSSLSSSHFTFITITNHANKYVKIEDFFANEEELLPVALEAIIPPLIIPSLSYSISKKGYFRSVSIHNMKTVASPILLLKMPPTLEYSSSRL